MHISPRMSKRFKRSRCATCSSGIPALPVVDRLSVVECGGYTAHLAHGSGVLRRDGPWLGRGSQGCVGCLGNPGAQQGREDVRPDGVGAALPHVPARGRRQQWAARRQQRLLAEERITHVRQVFHTHGESQATISFLDIDDIGAFLERRDVSEAGGDDWKHPPAGLNAASP